jgi:hypothetical protein
MKRIYFLALLAGLSVAACSSDDNSLTGTPVATGGICKAGDLVACACPASAAKGQQACQADGKSFGVCTGCPGESGGSGGQGGGASGGAGSGAAGAGAKAGAGGKGGSGQGGAGHAGSGAAGGQAQGGSGNAGGAAQGGSGNAGGAEQGGAAQGGSGNAGGDAQGGAAGEGGSGEAGSGQAGDGGSAAAGSGQAGGGAGGSPACPAGPDEDFDKDGWTITQGDCNDCDPSVNPGAFDFVARDAQGNPLPASQQIDEDCDGTAAQAETVCDQGLAAAVKGSDDVAHTLGLCRTGVSAAPADPKQRTWGVLKSGFNAIGGAFLKTPIQSSLQFGILPSFGGASKAREGSSLFALSSGVARATGQAGFPGDTCAQSQQTGQSTYPPGFPKSGSCGTTGDPFDGVAYDMEIRVPTNAHSFSFDYRFFTCEYPQYVCQAYNDVFAVLMGPSPLMAGDKMADATNSSADVAFQTNANGTKEVIGVNNQDFLRACAPGVAGYVNCKSEAELAGTGFEMHAGSSWVRATVPVEPGSTLSLRFAIWDSGDGVLDSTALVDHFAWHAETAAQVISEVQTSP